MNNVVETKRDSLGGASSVTTVGAAGWKGGSEPPPDAPASADAGIVIAPDLWQKTESFPLDDPNASYPFSKRLQKERGYSDAYLAAVLLEYRRFMALKASCPGDDLAPCFEVDTVWRTHILYSQNYRDFCLTCFSRMIEHNECYDSERQFDRRELTKKLMLDVFPEHSVEIWKDYGVISRDRIVGEFECPETLSVTIIKLGCMFYCLPMLNLAWVQYVVRFDPEFLIWKIAVLALLFLTLLFFFLPWRRKLHDVCNGHDLERVGIALCAVHPSPLLADDVLLNDRAFLRRYAMEQWVPVPFLRAVVREYQKFMYLLTIERGLTPSRYVDEVWHLHLQHTEAYAEYCKKLGGHFIAHGPTSGGAAEEERYERQYAKSLALYGQTFGEPPPSVIWGQKHSCISLGRDTRRYLLTFVYVMFFAYFAASAWVITSSNHEWLMTGGLYIIEAVIFVIFFGITLGIFGDFGFPDVSTYKQGAVDFRPKPPETRHDDVACGGGGCGGCGC